MLRVYFEDISTLSEEEQSELEYDRALKKRHNYRDYPHDGFAIIDPSTVKIPTGLVARVTMTEEIDNPQMPDGIYRLGDAALIARKYWKTTGDISGIYGEPFSRWVQALEISGPTVGGIAGLYIAFRDGKLEAETDWSGERAEKEAEKARAAEVSPFRSAPASEPGAPADDAEFVPTAFVVPEAEAAASPMERDQGREDAVVSPPPRRGLSRFISWFSRF